MPGVRYSQSAQDALFKFINTFPLHRTVESWADLDDATVFAQILHDLDPDFDPSQLEHSANRRESFQTIHRALSKYINIHVACLEGLERHSDFKSLTDDVGRNVITQLAGSLVAATLFGHNNKIYIVRMQKALDSPSMKELQSIIVQKQNEATQLRDQGSASGDADEPAFTGGAVQYDPHLALEAAEAELSDKTKHVDILKKQCADLNTRIEHLQESLEAMKDEKAHTEQQLEEYQLVARSGTDQRIKDLEDRIREQDATIDQQMSMIEEDKLAKSRLQHELATLQQKVVHLQELDDEVNELRYQNQELAKKANTLEWYKQKLETHRYVESENKNLMFEKDQLQEDMSKRLVEYEKLQRKAAQLEATNNDYRSRFADYEYQQWESESTSRAQKEDYNKLQIQFAEAEEKLNHHERHIAELLDQIHSGQGGGSGDTPGANHTAFNLEEELQQSTKEDNASSPGAVELARLRAENNLLRNNMGSATENAQLHMELEESRRKCQRLQEKYNDVYEQAQVRHGQVHAMLENMTTEEHEAYRNISRQLLEVTAELEKERRLKKEAEVELADSKRALLIAQTDLSAVSKDQLRALEELKSADQMVSESLRAELDSLRKSHRILATDHQQLEAQLLSALRAKEELLKDTAKAAEAGPDDVSYVAATAAVKEKLEKARARLKEYKEQLEKSSQEKHDLQRRLKLVQDGVTAAAQKTADQQMIRNLQKENALVTSAWYDLTSRLQSNHVVLQRRNDMPRSWLNKQRQMVNATPRR